MGIYVKKKKFNILNFFLIFLFLIIVITTLYFFNIFSEKKIFDFYQDNKIEKFRVINALKPGTFEDETKSFAIAVVSDLNVVDDPLNTVKQMIEFSINFAEKFYATLCDQDRTPITKQMISHIESRAQDIARLKQLNISDEEN